jgi:hypothetical protein
MVGAVGKPSSNRSVHVVTSFDYCSATHIDCSRGIVNVSSRLIVCANPLDATWESIGNGSECLCGSHNLSFSLMASGTSKQHQARELERTQRTERGNEANQPFARQRRRTAGNWLRTNGRAGGRASSYGHPGARRERNLPPD